MLYVGFCPEDFEQGIGGAEHDVFRYRNELEAARAFESEFVEREFSNQYMVTPWTVPDEWSYRSPIADRFRFACGQLDWPNGLGRPLWTCTALAQYDEYISVFGTHLSYMTLQNLERILTAIDERMASYLEKDID